MIEQTKKITECSICGTEKSKMWLCKGNWTLCDRCSKDISDWETQPKKEFNMEILAEVFFRRGKGENITYEELHNKNSDLKFIKFLDLLDLK